MVEVKGEGARQDTERGLLFGMEHRRCHRCLMETLCPVPCEGCNYSRYCSASCQRDAWEEHHRWECPLGADLRMMGVMSQLALRVTLKAGLKNIHMARGVRDEHTKLVQSCFIRESSDSYPCHTSYYSDSYLSVFHLLHHLNCHSPGLRFLCAVTVATLYLKLSQAGPPLASWDLSRPPGGNEEGGIADRSSELWLLGSAVLRHILQLRCNAQAVVMLQDTGDSYRFGITLPQGLSESQKHENSLFPLLMSVASTYIFSESVGNKWFHRYNSNLSCFSANIAVYNNFAHLCLKKNL